MQVEPATGADVPRLCELLEMLFTQEAEFSPDREKQARGLRMIIDNPAVGTILVLKDGGEIIGMVNLLYTVSTYLGAKVGLVEDVIIAPSHRGNGAGGELLQAAVDHASQQGCQRLTVLTDHANEAAQRLYRKLDFVASEMVPYRLTLPSSPDEMKL